jgi:DNA-binding CsgD family transcriptional regulator
LRGQEAFRRVDVPERTRNVRYPACVVGYRGSGTRMQEPRWPTIARVAASAIPTVTGWAWSLSMGNAVAGPEPPVPRVARRDRQSEFDTVSRSTRMSRPRSTTVATENLPAGGTVVFRSEGAHGGQPRSRFASRTAMRWAAAASGMRPVRSALTPREWEVLDLMTTGASTWQISDELVVSLDTVQSQVKDILRKLGVHSRFSGGGDCKRPRASLPAPVDGELSARPDSGMGEKSPLARSNRAPVGSLHDGLPNSRQHRPPKMLGEPKEGPHTSPSRRASRG